MDSFNNLQQLIKYMDSGNQDQMEEDYMEEEAIGSIICDSCGYENDIYGSSCLACQKGLYQVEEEIENQIACYICGLLLSISLYEDHTIKCEFERKIEVLKGRKAFDKNIVFSNKVDIKKKIKKSETKKCMYCGEAYMQDFINSHQKKCPSKPKPNTKFQPKPQIEAIPFKIQSVLYPNQIDRLTQIQIKAVTYMHKKAIFEDKKTQDAFLLKAKGLGYNEEETKVMFNYFQKKAPFIIHVNLEKYAQFFLADSSYKNLFQTESSGGSNSKIWRKQKEDAMFNNIFFDASHHERVKYGAVNITNDPKGILSAKGYGKSYLILKDQVKARCTITHHNSSGSEGQLFGTIKNCSHILNTFSDEELKATFKASQGQEVSSKVLKSYKQIQIHGPIQFSRDVERIGIDMDELKNQNSLDNILTFIKLYGVDYKVF